MKELSIENFILANGRVLIEGIDSRSIYKVIKVSKNANYDSIGKKIEVGDIVASGQYMYHYSFKINDKEYFVVKPKVLIGYFDQDKEVEAPKEVSYTKKEIDFALEFSRKHKVEIKIPHQVDGDLNDEIETIEPDDFLNLLESRKKTTTEIVGSSNASNYMWAQDSFLGLDYDYILKVKRV